MKRFLRATTLAAVLTAAAASAQQPAKTQDGLPPVQPPPAMDDPGTAVSPSPATQPPAQVKVNANAPTTPLGNSDAESQAAAEDARRRSAAPVPALPPEPERKFDSPGLPPEVQKAAEASELPVITVRQEGNETIEEYRKRGKIFAQHIVTKDSGSTKWYVDPAYKGPMPPQIGGPGHVTPVEYKVLGW